jgi:catechol 2,3-dioxygenase
VHLYVRDLDEAERFYHEGLGLDKIVWSYPGALFMSAGGYHHHLGTNTWAAGAPLATDDDARLIDWEVVVPTTADADAAAQSISDAGHPVERSTQGHAVRDPWGTTLRLVSDR